MSDVDRLASIDAREPSRTDPDPGRRTRIDHDPHPNGPPPGPHAESARDAPRPRGADTVPVLTGDHVRLRAVNQGDYLFLIDLQTAPENLLRWRYRGTTQSPEQILQSLWQGVLAQFLIVGVDTGEPIGLVVCYNPEFRYGYAFLAMIVAPQYEMTGWTFEAMALFITYLFETFGFYKLYFEMIEFNYRNLVSGEGSIFHLEGCLQNHEQHLGHRWHLYTLAIYHDEWHHTLAGLAPDLADIAERIKP
jgi:RimJ/RimL family protein N-acetyltransferase